MAQPDLVLMGRASGAFGVKGEVKVFPFCRDPEIFARAGRIVVGSNPEAARSWRVVSLRVHGGRVLLTLEGISDREGAQSLGGQWVWVPGPVLPPLQEGEYYWYQMKGALVVTTQGLELGRVREVTFLGGHDLLLVEAPDGKEALIPVVEGLVMGIDLAGSRITVELPPGLLDAQGWPEEDRALVALPEGEAD